MRVPADPAGHEGVVHREVGEGGGRAEVDRGVLHTVAQNSVPRIPSIIIKLLERENVKKIKKNNPIQIINKERTALPPV